jgi:hypothetical protein
MMPFEWLQKKALLLDDAIVATSAIHIEWVGGEVANWQLGQHGTTKASRMAVKAC